MVYPLPSWMRRYAGNCVATSPGLSALRHHFCFCSCKICAINFPTNSISSQKTRSEDIGDIGSVGSSIWNALRYHLKGGCNVSFGSQNYLCLQKPCRMKVCMSQKGFYIAPWKSVTRAVWKMQYLSDIQVSLWLPAVGLFSGEWYIFKTLLTRYVGLIKHWKKTLQSSRGLLHCAHSFSKPILLGSLTQQKWLAAMWMGTQPSEWIDMNWLSQAILMGIIVHFVGRI